MKRQPGHAGNGSRVLRSFIFVGPAALLALAAGVPSSLNLRGFLFVFVGTIALLSAGFPVRDIAAAFRRAVGRVGERAGASRPGRIFEAMARNALSLGFLATLICVVQLVQSFEGAPAHFLALVAGASSPAFWGMVIAAFFGVAAVSLRGQEARIDTTKENDGIADMGRPSGFSLVRWLGHLVMGALILWMIVPPGDGHGLGSWLDSWPAWLMVLGGTLFLALIHGNVATGDGLTLGFSCSGLIAAAWALLQTLATFSSNSIAQVAAAMGGITTSWFVCLAGLLLVAYPLTDRASSPARGPGLPLRAAWYLVPFLVLAFLVITLLLVMTPIEKQV